MYFISIAVLFLTGIKQGSTFIDLDRLFGVKGKGFFFNYSLQGKVKSLYTQE